MGVKGRWRKYPSKTSKTLKECPDCGFSKEMKTTKLKPGEAGWIYYTEYYPCPHCGYKHGERKDGC